MTRTRWMWGVALGGYTLASQAGCTSIKSTVVSRDPDGCGWTTKKHRGMPVTVKVPTSVRLSIVETRYFSTDGKMYLAKNLSWVKTDAPMSGAGCEPLASREVKHDILETAETFYVDIPRPAAGTLDYGMTIDPATGFFTAVNSNINDKTLQDITKAFGGVVDALPKKDAVKGKPTSARPLDNSAAGADAPVVEIVSEVAYKLFDVRSANLAAEMREFAAGYITACHSTCETTPAAQCQAKPAVPPAPATPPGTPPAIGAGIPVRPAPSAQPATQTRR